MADGNGESGVKQRHPCFLVPQNDPLFLETSGSFWKLESGFTILN